MLGGKGRKKRAGEGVKSLVIIPNRQFASAGSLQAYSAFTAFVRVTQCTTWQCIWSAVLNLELKNKTEMTALEDIL